MGPANQRNLILIILLLIFSFSVAADQKKLPEILAAMQKDINSLRENNQELYKAGRMTAREYISGQLQLLEIELKHTTDRTKTLKKLVALTEKDLKLAKAEATAGKFSHSAVLKISIASLHYQALLIKERK